MVRKSITEIPNYKDTKRSTSFQRASSKLHDTFMMVFAKKTAVQHFTLSSALADCFPATSKSYKALEPVMQAIYSHAGHNGAIVVCVTKTTMWTDYIV